MQTNIRFTGMDTSDKLRDYVEEKTLSFTKLLHDEIASSAICAYELKRSTKHQKGDVCTVECTLEADGKVYRVCKEEPTFEKAIDKVKDDILQSLRDDKEKNSQSFKKGAAKIKEMLQEDNS
jgi:ribosomal subunit interface protein